MDGDPDPSDVVAGNGKARSARQPGRRSTTGENRKRAKTSTACLPCRRKKMKCEGKSPCDRCLKTDTECIMEPAYAKKGQSSATKNENYLGQEQAAADNSSSTTIAANVPGSSLPVHGQDGISVSMTGRGLYVPSWSATDHLRRASAEATRTDGAALEHRYDLIEVYFKHVHPYLPILDRSLFQEQLRQQAVCPLLLNAMYSVACRWQQQPPSDEKLPGWKYYSAAFQMLDQNVDIPRLSTVQSLILMIKYHESIRRLGYFSRTRLYLQLAFRICQDLGLIHVSRQNMSAEHQAVFWAVYGYDVLASTEQGTLPNFNDCMVDYPAMLERIGQDEGDANKEPGHYYFHWIAKILHAHGTILDFVCTSVPETKQRDVLSKRLEELEANLYKAAGNELNFRTFRFLRLALHFATILLHRSFGFNNRSDSVPHTDRCKFAALGITHTVGELLQEGGVNSLYYCMRGIQQIIHYLASAITIFRLILQFSPQTDSAIEEALVRALDMIHFLIKLTPALELDPNTSEDDAGASDDATVSPQLYTVSEPTPSPPPSKDRQVTRDPTENASNPTSSVPFDTNALTQRQPWPPPQQQQQLQQPPNVPAAISNQQQRYLTYYQQTRLPAAPVMMDYTMVPSNSLPYYHPQPQQNPYYNMPIYPLSGGAPIQYCSFQPMHLIVPQQQQQQYEQYAFPPPHQQRRRTTTGLIPVAASNPPPAWPCRPPPPAMNNGDIPQQQQQQAPLCLAQESMMGLLLDQSDESLYPTTNQPP